MQRWTGPEDVDATGVRPWEGRQERLVERPWADRLDAADLDLLLSGTVLVLRREGQVDYLLRDHHLVDVQIGRAHV